MSPRPSSRARASELLTVSILTALFLLLGIGAMVWAVRGGALTPPTPTPTATLRAAVAATPDFRATRTAEDMLTQVAFSAELATAVALQLMSGTPTPVGIEIPGENAIMLPVISQVDAALATAIAQSIAETLQPELPPGEAPPDVMLPGILLPGEATAAAPVSPLETPSPPDAQPTQPDVQLPIVDQGGATATPDAPNVELPTLDVAPDTPTWTPEPTATFTPEPPTETPTTAPTPTPTVPFSVQSLAAQVAGSGEAPVRIGPSSLYTQTASISAGTNITLLNRDSTGEWLWFCCNPANNAPAWIRSAAARPVNNPTLAPPREGANPNDALWLAERGIDGALTPLPTSIPPSPADFAMLRVDKGNTGRIAAVPALPYSMAWPVGSQAGVAGQAYTSPAIVAGQSVIAASADGHLYAFDRDSGSQRWRHFLGEQVRIAPMAEGSIIYVISTSGRLTALADQGQSAAVIYQRDFGMEARGGILAASNRLVFIGRQGDGEHLWVIEKATGNVLENVGLGTALAQMPAVGGQTVYVADDSIRAIDIFTGETVWQILQGTNFTSPPLYVSPGVNTIAELYVADDQGRIWALDANTGANLWTASINSIANSLAVNESMLFASGNGMLRGLQRQRRNEGQVIWQANLPGNVPGGVVVDSGRVLAVTDGGNIQVFDAATGAIGVAGVQVGALSGAAAVSAPYIYAPTQSGVLHAVRGGD